MNMKVTTRPRRSRLKAAECPGCTWKSGGWTTKIQKVFVSRLALLNIAVKSFCNRAYVKFEASKTTYNDEDEKYDIYVFNWSQMTFFRLR